MPTMDSSQANDLTLKRRMLLDAARGATDSSEFSWLTAFDGDDQRTFRLELLDALLQASDSLVPAERCISEWRTTARALSNEKSRRILIGAGDDQAAFAEVERHK